MTRRQSPGGDDTSHSRNALLRALRASDHAMTVQELAHALALHKNSVRFHLARLIARGLVREDQSSPSGPGRPRLVYTPVERQPARHDGHQLLAEALSEHLAHVVPEPDEVAVRAGFEQALRMSKRDPSAEPATALDGKEFVTAMMLDYGFDPEWDPDGERLWLRTCPFRPLSDRRPAVVCSVHLGLMRGALDAIGAPLEVVSLDAASAPFPCLAVLKERASQG